MKKFPVAVAITALVVAGCLAYSLFVAPVAAIKVKPGDWIADEAGVLSESTEDALRSYNQSFDQNYGSVIAVATVRSTRGWTMEDYALKLGENWELGSKDLVLLLDIGGEDAYLMEGGDWTTLDPSAMLNQTMAADFFGGNYDSAVLSLFSAMSGWYPENGGHARSDPYAASTSQSNFNSTPVLGGFIMLPTAAIIMLVIIVLLVLAGGLGGGHRRGHRPPPPPPPPGGPRPGPAPRSGSYRPAPGPRNGPPPRPSSGPRPGAPRPSAPPRPASRPSGSSSVIGKARSAGGRIGGSRPSGGSRGGSFGGGRGGGFGGRR